MQTCTHDLTRPADISWLLYKLPDPRGIYIPRLLSIIRHLSLFFPLLHQTPQTCCGKILISVPMTWHRAIEIAMQTEREEQGGGGRWSGETKMCRKWQKRRVSVCGCATYWQNWQFCGGLIWQSTDLALYVFIPEVCMSMCVSWYRDKVSAQVWSVSTALDSFF